MSTRLLLVAVLLGVPAQTFAIAADIAQPAPPADRKAAGEGRARVTLSIDDVTTTAALLKDTKNKACIAAAEELEAAIATAQKADPDAQIISLSNDVYLDAMEAMLGITDVEKRSEILELLAKAEAKGTISEREAECAKWHIWLNRCADEPGFEPLTLARVSFGAPREGDETQKQSVVTELGRGTAYIFEGSIAATLSDSAPEEATDPDNAAQQAVNDESAQRLISSGGDLIVAAQMRILELRDPKRRYNRLLILCDSSMNFGMPPTQGQSRLEQFYSDGGCGVQGSVEFEGTGAFGVFFAARAGGVYGNRAFRDSLGTPRTRFSYGSFTGGFVILRSMRVSLTGILPEKVAGNRLFPSPKNLRDLRPVVVSLTFDLK